MRDGRVLVVDDDPDILELVSTLLAAEGVSVELAEDGARALEVLERAEGPSIVLLDWRMPKMNGEAFLRALRAHPPRHPPKVVVISGDYQVFATAKALGAVECVRKPFDFGALVDVIRRQGG